MHPITACASTVMITREKIVIDSSAGIDLSRSLFGDSFGFGIRSCKTNTYPSKKSVSASGHFLFPGIRKVTFLFCIFFHK